MSVISIYGNPSGRESEKREMYASIRKSRSVGAVEGATSDLHDEGCIGERLILKDFWRTAVLRLESA
jgi:hypothetical protein